MTGILLAILCTVGKILLGILIVFAVLIVLILFAPFSYRADAVKNEDVFTVRAAVSWLFRFLVVKIAYDAGGKTLQPDLRVAGISVLPLIGRIRNRKKKTSGSGNGKERKIRREAAKKPSVPPGKKISDIKGDSGQELKIEVIRARKQHPLHRLTAHVAARIGKLKTLIGRIRTGTDLAAEWFGYLSSESFASAKDVLFREGIPIFRHILPRRISGCVRFGTDDPAATGMVLGTVCVLYPVLPETFTIEPEFTESCLEADLSAGGRVFLIVPLIHAVRILLSKDVRLLIRRIRRIISKDKKQNSTGKTRKGRGKKWRKTGKALHFRTT